jgi:hypothetical protein
MKTSWLIENTLSARRRNVVSRKWYWEGYFVEGGVLEEIQSAEACNSLHVSIFSRIVLDMFMLRLDRTTGTKQFLHRCIMGETLGNQMGNFGRGQLLIYSSDYPNSCANSTAVPIRFNRQCAIIPI